MELIERYLDEMEAAVRRLSRGDIREVVEVLFACWVRRGTAYVIGNGGSASTASHMMNDLHKCTIVEGKPRFRAIALTDNVPLITAVSNDVEYAEIFVEPLRAHLDPGDVVIGISGSGNSPNVLRAIAYAKENGCVTIGLCGSPGGKLAQLADVRVVFPAALIGQQEDGHLMINHVVALALRERIAESGVRFAESLTTA
jgi:D-sedoheptulose 7-phosphate isomerase